MELEKLLVKKETDIEIKLELIDIPALHSYTNNLGQEFFDELGQTEDL